MRNDEPGEVTEVPRPTVSKARSPAAIDARVAARAAMQHGLVTSAQLVALGMTHDAAALRARRGQLHRVHRGVYAVGHRALSHEGHLLAAVLASGPGAALSHLAAAAHWQLWRRRVDCVDVVVPVSRRRNAPVWRLHSTRSLPHADVTRRRGIPVTTVARTVIDLGEVLTAWQIANVLHEAAFRNVLQLRAVERALARGSGRRGVANVRHALELHRTGSRGTKSGHEDRCVEHLERHRARTPVTNYPVMTPDGPIEVDFYWEREQVVLEVDGSGHDRQRTRLEDRDRDRRLAALGIEVVRCAPHEIPTVAARLARRMPHV